MASILLDLDEELKTYLEFLLAAVFSKKGPAHRLLAKEGQKVGVESGQATITLFARLREA